MHSSCKNRNSKGSISIYHISNRNVNVDFTSKSSQSSKVLPKCVQFISQNEIITHFTFHGSQGQSKLCYATINCLSKNITILIFKHV